MPLLCDPGRKRIHGGDRGLRYGNPRGQRVGWLETLVRRVLMPRDERLVLRLLLKKAGSPAEHIGTDQVLDRVEKLWMGDEIAKEREWQVRLDAEARHHLRAELCLDLFHVPPNLGDLVLRQQVDRAQEAIVLVESHLFRTQSLVHRSLLALSKADLPSQDG